GHSLPHPRSRPIVCQSWTTLSTEVRWTEERTRLACCRWRLANDFLWLNKKWISARRRNMHARARALPGKDSRKPRHILSNFLAHIEPLLPANATHTRCHKDAHF